MRHLNDLLMADGITAWQARALRDAVVRVRALDEDLADDIEAALDAAARQWLARIREQEARVVALTAELARREAADEDGKPEI